jgi:hypothetical protein
MPVAAQNLVDSGQVLPGIWAGQAEWEDYDSDGDLDLALIGETVENGECRRMARLYRNDDGVLVEDLASPLIGVYYGDVAWGDYNSDGFTDLAIAGLDEFDRVSMRLYNNQPDADNPSRRRLVFDNNQVDENGSFVFEETGVRYASLAWGDYDSDGDLDLIVIGLNFNGVSLTVLYRNNTFKLLERDAANSTAVVSAHNGDVAWGDLDNDGDLDLALMGENRGFGGGGLGEITEIYRNRPVGQLALDETLSRQLSPKLKNGDLAWTDYNNDGNLDLSMSGRDNGWNAQLLLYRNRPAGSMNLDPNFNPGPFNALNARLDWIDYDNDGDQDLAASGVSVLSSYQTAIFTNSEGFLSTFSTENGLVGLAGGASAWADYDNDGIVDLFVAGVDRSGQRQAVLYRNEGFFPFNSQPNPPSQLNRPKVTGSRTVFTWLPGDDFESANISYNVRVGTEVGRGDILTEIVTDGRGNADFQTQKILNRFLARDTYFWSVQAIDGAGSRSAWIEDQRFSVEQFVSSDQAVRGLQAAAMAWGDFDNDGDPDLLQMGQNRSLVSKTVLYENINKTLTETVQDALAPLQDGDAAWGDYDNDGDLDLAMSGNDQAGNRFSLLYENEFDENVSERRLILVGGFAPDLSFGSVDWGDADSDGDLDLALLGQSSDIVGGLQASFTRVHVNDGEGGFTDASNDLPGLNNGEARWGDVDNDGDLDLAAVGLTVQNEVLLNIYINDGLGGLSDSNTGLDGLFAGDIAWADYDRDGDLDLAAAGFDQSFFRQTRVYQNDGNGGFSNVTGEDIAGTAEGDLAWGDIDNDQDMDLLVTGRDNANNPVLQFVENTIGRFDPTAPFVPVDLFILQGLIGSAVSLADIDTDGDLDLVSLGQGIQDGRFSPLANINDNLEAEFNANLAPSAPVALAPEDSGSSVSLSWEAATDDGDPPPGNLTYNLRVGTTSGGHEVISGITPVGSGNVGHGLSRRLDGLASGRYFWSVQAVDAGFAPSAWTPSGSFIIDTVPPEVTDFTFNRTQAGIGQTVTLALSLVDVHAGIDADLEPTVVAVINGQEFAFTALQFTSSTWNGQLIIRADMPTGAATVQVRGLADRKENVLVPVVAPDPVTVDTDIPQVVASEPAAGTVDVAVDTDEIKLFFSEALDRATVTSENIQLKLDNTPIGQLTEPVYEEEEGGVKVEIFPAEDLQAGTRYTVEIGAAIQDLFGNRAAGTTTFTFDTLVPELVGTSPQAGDAAVPAGDNRLTATFSGPLVTSVLASRGDAVEVRRSGEAVGLSGTPQFNGEDNVLTIELAEPLKPGSRYEVTLASQVAGPLAAEGFSWQFLTPTPQLVATIPANDGRNVSTLNPVISARFDNPIDQDAARADGGITVTVGPGPVAVNDIIYDAADRSLSFTLVPGLGVGASYQVLLAAAIGGPLRERDYAWRFETAVPQLTGSDPTDGNTNVPGNTAALDLIFDGLLDEPALEGANGVQLLQGGQTIPIEAPVFVPGTGTLTITPFDGLRVGTEYQLRVPAAAGGALRRGDYLVAFSTATPVLIDVTPDLSDNQVSIDLPEAVAGFSVPLDLDQVSAANFNLSRNGETEPLRDGDPVNRGDGRYGFAPAADWQVGSAYVVQIAASVTGPLGTSRPLVWRFRTAIPDLTQTVPAAGDTAVSVLEPTIQAIFDQPINEAALLSQGNVQLFQGGQGISISVPGYEPQTRTVTLTPVEGLRAGSRYRVAIAAEIGGPLRGDAGDYSWQFSTRVPVVQRALPLPDEEGVSIVANAIRLELTGPAAQVEQADFQLRSRPVGAPDATPNLVSITNFGSEDNGQIINLAAEGGLLSDVVYEVVVDRTAFGDLATTGFRWSFSTAARLADPSQGGTVASADRSLELFFPPNGLAGGTGEIIIRPVREEAAKLTVQDPGLSQVGRAFELDAGEGQLLKPITLKMGYTDVELGGRDEAKVAVFRQAGNDWKRVGGSVDAVQKQVRTALNVLGTYALFEDLNTAVGRLKIAQLDCQPRAFSPRCSDSTDGNTYISFQLKGSADVTIRVYNSSGRLERVVKRGEAMVPGVVSLPWDGCDEDKKPVASGLYVVVVTAGSVQAEKIVAVVR